MDTDPYASHIPVLKAVSRLVSKAEILEFGIGAYSTSLFLNDEFYPGSRLTSVDDDAGWIRKCQQRTPRHTAVACDPLRYCLDHMDGIALAKLVFIDSRDTDSRVGLARIFGSLCLGQIVIMHDVENPAYAPVFGFFKHSGVFKKLTPWTAVFCDDISSQSI
jgi:predicted O-methyltransferase YrrM